MTKGKRLQPEKGSGITRFLLCVLLSLVSIIATLAGVELALRMLDQPRIFKHYNQNIYRFYTTHIRTEHGPLYLNNPGRITFRYDGNPRGYFGPEDEVHHDVNPAGFRGPGFMPKPDGMLRLVFLGDSFTFGEGVHNQDTYPEVTARLLRKSGQRVESCNLGVGGYNTSQEADVLRLFGFDLQPDVVVLGYTLNDAEPPLFEVDPISGQPVRRVREDFIEAEGPPRDPPDSPLYRLHLARAIWKAHRSRYLSRQTVDYYLSIHAPEKAARQESEQALRAIISECREHAIPCIVVMFPILYDLSESYPFAAIHDQIGQVVREAGGRYIDLLPVLKGRDSRDLIVHPTDQHPNDKVHAIAGKLVAEEIRRMPEFELKP